MDLLDSEGKAAVLRFVVLPRVVVGRVAGFTMGITGQLSHLLNIKNMQVRRSAQAHKWSGMECKRKRRYYEVKYIHSLMPRYLGWYPDFPNFLQVPLRVLQDHESSFIHFTDPFRSGSGHRGKVYTHPLQGLSLRLHAG